MIEFALGCFVVAAAVAVFVIGFAVGFNACQERERMMDGQRRIGAALEHWHGHTTHKGRTIISPACQAIVDSRKDGEGASCM